MNEPDLRALLAREIARREKLELENESLRRELAACQLELRKAHPQVSDGSVRARLPEVREANAKVWWQSTPSDLCGPNAFLPAGGRCGDRALGEVAVLQGDDRLV
jgi:hypothetical protein